MVDCKKLMQAGVAGVPGLSSFFDLGFEDGNVPTVWLLS